MIHLTLEPITAEAFAPFGTLMPPQPGGTGRLDLIDELVNTRESAKPRLSIAAVTSKALPLVAVEMERHVHSSQAFVPLDGAEYLIMVAPHGPDGLPDMAGLRAFRVPGDTGINYRVDTWHHPLTALGEAGRFAVLTFVDGTAGDEQFVPLPEHVSIGA
ncbi:ureidoglycolate lyase [Lichenifustis flavocetrariae]|uniref:Ureidoglycolate lyase n=1 Tax=Lichenifustis flavocetrariae TaxID=2949735 RepID=A0AA42CQA5_9HYPH|nr:ureidoglycolate lyase [Lichenifustis flavocetrariae]MCW6511255.1 ureidoglycolate lyase [Lichenifustis flavocetrariae]